MAVSRDILVMLALIVNTPPPLTGNSIIAGLITFHFSVPWCKLYPVGSH